MRETYMQFTEYLIKDEVGFCRDREEMNDKKYHKKRRRLEYLKEQYDIEVDSQ